MKQKMNTYLFGASMVALTFSLNITNVNAAACDTMPSCSDLGYTQTSCENGMESIKCPFDTSKMKCIGGGGGGDCESLGYKDTSCSTGQGWVKLLCPYDSSKFKCVFDVTGQYAPNACAAMGYLSDSRSSSLPCPEGYEKKKCPMSSSFYTCELKGYDSIENCVNLGYKNNAKEQCAANTLILHCPLNAAAIKCTSLCEDGYAKNASGVCAVEYHQCSGANVGDIYYYDNTCSSQFDGSKTAIGIVSDAENRIVIALDAPSKHWNDGTTTYNDIPTISNGCDSSAMNGLELTNKIVAFAQSSGQAHEAAQYCHSKTTGGKNWFLPANGQRATWRKTNGTTPNRAGELLEAQLALVGGQVFGSDYMWVSQESSADSSCNAGSIKGDGESVPGTKKYNFKARCVFTY